MLKEDFSFNRLFTLKKSKRIFHNIKKNFMKKLEKLQSKAINKASLKYFTGALAAITSLEADGKTYTNTSCHITANTPSYDCADGNWD